MGETRDEESQQGSGGTAVRPNASPTLFAGLAANVLFFWGSISFLLFALYELNGEQRSEPARYAYISAFASNILSGVVEFFIDTCSSEAPSSSAMLTPSGTGTVASPQIVRHGRYSASHPWNICISTLFIAGTLLDIVAFFLWDNRKFITEHRVLYAGSHTWLLTAIAVLWAKPPKFCLGGGLVIMDRADDLGNVLFFVGVVVDCLVRYLDVPADPHAPESVHTLEFVSAPLWLSSACCYVLADLIRIL